jgi:microcystin degradation protein MlrC
MKFFMAGLDTETNTFSPIPTGLDSYEECLLAHGDATRKPLNYCSTQLDVWRRMGEEKGWAVIESLCAVAEPAGVTSRAVYESFREEILNDLRAAGRVDFVMLALHGAMVADGYDDVEGDLLSRVRAQVGEGVPIGVELDLHCHITNEMTRQATAIVLYKEYPHTDIEDRATELFQIIVAAVERRVHPVMATFDCRMVGSFRTQEQPLRDFVDRMKSLEGRDGILSVSLGHGFPWGDVVEAGVKVLVVTDADRGAAQRLATQLGRDVFEMRRALKPEILSIDDALDQVTTATATPVVLADVSDNAGGGASGDATFIVRRILERRVSGAVSALHWDPVAVRFCREAGEGATLDLRIGGKCGATSGLPLDLRVVVKRIASGVTQRFGNVAMPIGDAVWVKSEGIDLVLNTRRTQVFHPECMTRLGMDLLRYRLVVVKSTNHFYAGFAPIAAKIVFADAPGALRQRFEELPYTKRSHRFWPKVDDPFAD